MREIVFVRFESFYITAERPRDASREQPFVVLREAEVLDVSPSARAWNVREHIRARLARQRCPDLATVEHNPDLCVSLYNKVWSVFESITPQIEPVDLHEGFLDLTGCRKGKSIKRVMDEALWRTRFDTGLLAQWGGGGDRWMARLSCGENRSISENEEKEFLARIPIERLDLPADLLDRLARYGIHTVSELLSVPRTFFQTHLQLTSAEIEPFLERGDSVVQPLFPLQSFTLEMDVNSTISGDLERVMTALAAKAAATLRAASQQCGRIEISLRTRLEMQSRLFQLAKPTLSAQVFESLLRGSVTEDVTEQLVSIGLVLSNLTPRAKSQENLWPTHLRIAERMDKLDRARERLDRKYGFQTIRSGSDYARQIQPRFAQLIYARRGLYLP